MHYNRLKRKGKERKGTKSQDFYISGFLEKPPSEPILAKFSKKSREMSNLITCAHFDVYKLRG